MWVDSHCHLQLAGGDEHIARARAAGVEWMVCVGTDLETSQAALALADRHPDVYAAVGLHPHDASKLGVEWAMLEPLAVSDACIAIGECGFDLFYEHSPREKQLANFRAHIAAGRQSGLPVIVHTRDADDDTIRVLEEEMAKGVFAGLIHCFTGTQKLADASLRLGLYISVSGIATFKKSDALRDVIKTVPLERLLVETDAPFLAPVPHRGQTNEPAFVVHTAKMLAELKGVSEEELARVTTDNFFRLFSKVKRPAYA